MWENVKIIFKQRFKGNEMFFLRLYWVVIVLYPNKILYTRFSCDEESFPDTVACRWIGKWVNQGNIMDNYSFFSILKYKTFLHDK